jgi:hypothetical protein
MRPAVACSTVFLFSCCALSAFAQRAISHVGSVRGFAPHVGYRMGEVRPMALAPRFAPGGRGFGTRRVRPGFSATPAVLSRRVHPGFRRHFGLGPFDGAIASCLGLGLDIRFCRTHVTSLNSTFFGLPFWGYGYPYDWAGNGAYSSGNNDDALRQLAGQVDQLSAQLAQIREEQLLREYERERRPEPAEASSRPPTPNGQGNAAVPPAAPATLVFKDGRRQQVQNYAVVGNTLWIFNEQRARKLPLSELDLDQTRKANEANGVELFR